MIVKKKYLIAENISKSILILYLAPIGAKSLMKSKSFYEEIWNYLFFLYKPFNMTASNAIL